MKLRPLWTFRPTEDDEQVMAELRQATGIRAEAEVIRLALRHLLRWIHADWRGGDSTPTDTPTPPNEP